MKLDRFSYHLGAADCFCEMVRAGVKRIALSHPCDSRQERDAFLPEFDRLCEKYGVRYSVEDHAFLTDLFPLSLWRGGTESCSPTQKPESSGFWTRTQKKNSAFSKLPFSKEA